MPVLRNSCGNAVHNHGGVRQAEEDGLDLGKGLVDSPPSTASGVSDRNGGYSSSNVFGAAAASLLGDFSAILLISDRDA